MMEVNEVRNILPILDFDKGPYILMLIARKKNNKDITHSKEIVIRRVVYKEEMLQLLIDELFSIANADTKHEYKLYISMNPRSTLKAYVDLKKRMATWDFEMLHNPEIYKRILKLDMEWISCLARNSAKKKWFMLDLDDKGKLRDVVDMVCDICNILHNDIFWFETKNGHHILFEPCDTRQLMESIKVAEIDCELKRDDLICIGYEEK